MAHEHSHSHGPSRETERGALKTALVLIVSFMICEVVVGIVTSSLALLSDAAHMVTDAIALAMSLVAARLVSRPAGGSLTYGLGRAEILSAQANGVTLLILGVLIVIDSVKRLFTPPGVEGLPVLIVALVGIVVNLVAARVLAGGSGEGERSLNMEGSYRHIVTDLFGFIATAAAGAVILITGFTRADAIASLLIAAILLFASYGLLKESGRVFMEAAPAGMDPEEIGRGLASQPGVVEVHDLHVWEVTSGFPALSAHVVVHADEDCHAVRRALQQVAHDRFEITHTTLQVDHEAGEQPPLQIEVPDTESPSAPASHT